MTKPILSLACCALFCALFSGCSMKGVSGLAEPMDFKKIPTQKTLNGESSTFSSSSLWWTRYADPQLSRIISKALSGSPDLSVFKSRVLQAEARAKEAGSSRYPNVDLSVSAGNQTWSSNHLMPKAMLPRDWIDTAQTQTSISWDLDIWGRNSDLRKASDYDVERARNESLYASLNLSSEISLSYMRYARLHALNQLENRVLALRKENHSILERLVSSGMSSKTVLNRSSSDVQVSESRLQEIESLMRSEKIRLAVLSGSLPDFSEEISTPSISFDPLTVSVEGIPIDVIGARPDIQASLFVVRSASSNVDVAEKDFLPNVSLGAVLGLQSIGLSKLFLPGSLFGQVGPALSLPIFNGGRLDARLDASKARYSEAVASYNSRVLTALGEAAANIDARKTVVARGKIIDSTISSAEATLKSIQRRRASGLAVRSDEITAELNLIASKASLLDLRFRAMELDVELGRILGGHVNKEISK